jgi:hypothetical protein
MCGGRGVLREPLTAPDQLVEWQRTKVAFEF